MWKTCQFSRYHWYSFLGVLILVERLRILGSKGILQIGDVWIGMHGRSLFILVLHQFFHKLGKLLSQCFHCLLCFLTQKLRFFKLVSMIHQNFILDKINIKCFVIVWSVRCRVIRNMNIWRGYENLLQKILQLFIVILQVFELHESFEKSIHICIGASRRLQRTDLIAVCATNFVIGIGDFHWIHASWVLTVYPGRVHWIFAENCSQDYLFNSL